MRYWRLAGFAWLVFLSAAYFWPSDSLYAITIWPPVVWTGLGLGLSLLGIRKKRARLQWALLAAWVGFWLAFGEEKHWVGDRVQRADKPDLVVVTLNCAGGSAEAAEEAFALKPDLILFQESPSQKDLQRLAEKHFGKEFGLVWGVDGSIVSRRKGLEEAIKTMAFSEAWIDTKVGRVQVVSLRLSPPVFRLDYWDPECWAAYGANRKLHREEMTEVAGIVSGGGQSHISIVGGDFNWTPDKEMGRILKGLSPISVGSGYSAVNEFPLARIDQVWVSPGFKGISRAVKTVNSDHRMVVVKLWKVL